MKRDQQSARRGRPGLLFLCVVVALLALVIYGYIRTRRSGSDRRLSAEIFYLSVAPPRANRFARAGGPISSVRIHYFVRNDGTDDYHFPERGRLMVMEREGHRLHAGVPDVNLEVPAVIAAGGRAEVVIDKGYLAENLPLDAWTMLYPDRLPGPPGPSGTYVRLTVTVEIAQQLMKRDSLTPDQLLEKFDVVGDGPTRECTPLARAILRRRLPKLSGFVLIDPEQKLQIELPLSRG